MPFPPLPDGFDGKIVEHSFLRAVTKGPVVARFRYKALHFALTRSTV